MGRPDIHNMTVFGFIKPMIDVHTMGVFTIANLLRDCGYKVYVADNEINAAIENIGKLNNYSLLKQWIRNNGISALGFSYRLDPQDGCDYFMRLYRLLQADNMFNDKGGVLRLISFAGLPDTCEMIKAKSGGGVLLFKGNETPFESLRMYGVPDELIPKSLSHSDPYDSMRMAFAKELISNERYKFEIPLNHLGYKECGTDSDTFIARLNFARQRHSLPIIRTHSGPYNPNREEALKLYNLWCHELSQSHLLDVLSIGSSQLTQSHFGENWDGLSNGGGVPVNSELEYRVIRENAKPMLTRTYSGTKNVQELARVHERALNISWHALSFWWFDELDGRGPNTLLQNLKEHFEALRYIATTGKPVEPNVPHHFAFRGADDISYIVSGFLAAKACKQMGIKHLILQNMLNTPKHTIGVQDLAKGRAMLKLVRELEDSQFQVSLQLRAGLDYFAPDLDYAKVQLAAVTCLMDDMEPDNEDSPEVIHVVNYCEAVRLATPAVILESIKITLNALREYRMARKLGHVPNMKYDVDVDERTHSMFYEAKEAICLLERYIPNLYSPEGFYTVFKEGFLPVPYLMDFEHKYSNATRYQTALKNGGISVVDEHGNIINTITRYKKILQV